MNKVKQITFIAVYVAIIVALQTLLSSINGIELTTLLFTVAAIFIPLSMSLTMVVVYCLIQAIMFGFGDICLKKENKKEFSNCKQKSFNYSTKSSTRKKLRENITDITDFNTLYII